jgi:hypothetical protein
MSVVGLSLPAHAGDYVVAGDDSYGLFLQHCEDNVSNNLGTYQTAVCMRVSYWQAGDHIEVKRVSVFTKGGAPGLRDANTLYIAYAAVRGPGGNNNWLKENVNVSKDADGTTDKNWTPNFNQDNNGSFHLDATVYWKDGTHDNVTFTQQGLDNK